MHQLIKYFLFTSSSILILFIITNAQLVSSKPQQQQQSPHKIEFDKHGDRKQQQQVDDQANHLHRTSPPSSSSSESSNLAPSSSISTNSPTSSLSSIPFQCPEQFGYYTDTRDCTKYYVCVFGEVLHESCTGGLRFSRELQTCDWPRNVQCPQQPASGGSGQQANSNGATTVAATIQPAITSTSTTTSASTAATSSQAVSSTTASSLSSSTEAGSSRAQSNEKQEEQQSSQTNNDNTVRPSSLLKGSSLVFADEGSDPQQPSFDEAVSPVITPDGTIHLHDGSGGTYGLTPNHLAHNQHSASGNGPPSGQSVDIFVKPLKATNQNTRTRQNQHLNSNSRSNSGKLVSLKPTSDPIANQPKGTRSNQFMTSIEDNQPNMNEDEIETSTELSSTDESVASQADQDSASEQENSNKNNNNQNENETENPDQVNSSASDHQTGSPYSAPAPAPGQQHQRQQQSGAYIPPVMAPNIGRQQVAHQATTTTGNSRETTSSQLLSVNNRQVDSSRNSFRPILVSSSANRDNNINQALPRELTDYSGLLFDQRGENNQPNNENNDNKLSDASLFSSSSLSDKEDTDGSEDDDSSLSSADDYNSSSVNSGNPSLDQDVGVINNDSNNNNNNNNNGQARSSISNSASARPRQQVHIPNSSNSNNPAPMRHNQTNLILTKGPNIFNNNPIKNNNNDNNNDRHSRMPLTQDSSSSSSNNNNNIRDNFHPPVNRFSHQQKPSNSNDNNNDIRFNSFANDSTATTSTTKLTRLQATSQFDPAVTDLPTTVSIPGSLRPPGANGDSRQAANAFLQQFPLPNQHQHLQQQASPASSQRSQNVLFSQQPFGLLADSNANINSNKKNFQLFEPTNGGQLSHGSTSSHLQQQQQQQQSSSLLQQQRRPRPPKRQQIPAGQPASTTSRRFNAGLQQQFPTTPIITTSTSAAKATQNRNQLFGSEVPTSTSSPTTNRFLPSIASDQPGGSSSSFFSDPSSDEHDFTTEPNPVTQTQPRFQQSSISGLRSTPASRQRDAITTTTTTTFGVPLSTTEMTPTSAKVRAFESQAEGENDGHDQQAFSVGQKRNLESQGQLRQNANLFSSTERSPPLFSTATTTGSGNLPTGMANLNTNSNSNLNLYNPTTGTTIAASTTTNQQQQSTPSSSSPSLSSSQTPAQEQDPQLVANRYLNSAMEAGQPFGAVDYDFEILNDNSTDRRNPTTTTATSTTSRANSSLVERQQPSSLAGVSNNLNTRQRERQSAGFSGQTTDNIANGGEGGSNIDGSTNAGLNNRRAQLAANNNNQRSQSARQRNLSSGNTNIRPQTAQLGKAAGGGGGAGISSIEGSAASVAGNPDNSSSGGAAAGSGSTTRKPRPTNKKISVNHEQAIANNRVSTEPAKRPDNLFSTPVPLQTATKCDNRLCRLPDCKCGDTLNPGNLDSKQIPQVVLLTFDDAVNDLNWEIYEELFTGRTNPNGCPILATFYVSHEWTDYGQVQTLYSRGHEMASHSITHSFGEKFSKHQWFKEVNGQREILNLYGGVKMNDVRGMRAPFLQIGGNKMFEMLYDANFTYDSSMPIFENSPPLWPYTLDYQLAHECMITPCPTKSFPGVWEVGMTMWVDLRGGRCSMGDACSNPPDEDGVYEMLMKNFNRHYKSNRAPFGLFYHSAWFNTVHHRRGFLRFLSQVNSLPDVFFTTNWQMLQWMRQPTPLREINSFEPWQCPVKTDRPPACYHPSVCNVKSEHGTRFMKTCQPCPANQQYPWVGVRGDASRLAQLDSRASNKAEAGDDDDDDDGSFRFLQLNKK